MEASLSDSTSFSPDLPELRLLCQLAGIKPSAMAAALNNPEHFNKHVNAEELTRYAGAGLRVIALITRISTHLTPYIDAHADKILKAKGRH
jgi:hypothetical protein